jgi:hypothetical protein
VRPSLLIALLLTASCSSETGTTSGTTAADATFKKDIMPIVRESCALTACHSSESKNLGIFLSNDAAQVYTELQKTSAQSGQKFVVAGDPTKSYIVTKLDDKQKKPDQGAQMPPDEMLPAAQRDLFRSWIKAGAKNN